ncbi:MULTISPECIES: hypothetical protein [unclassified Streptomyces]|uniref:hypothetical protein n=1 Tax=unclassified Streptomyces TaxID=2593676 RepID=UPI0029ADD6CB|nr:MULTISPECIES: hypothetical protein [unclassified Streptomyces]MDX3430854.1 hypothetical protein [Streptomyces sp. ME01-18a]
MRGRHACRQASSRRASSTAALLTGCASGDDWSTPRTGLSAVGELGAGFLGPEKSPAAGSTVTPGPGSWSEVRPSPGTRVVLLTAGGADGRRPVT